MNKVEPQAEGREVQHTQTTFDQFPLLRLEAGAHLRHDDAPGRRVASSIRQSLGLNVDSARMVKVFTLQGLSQAEAQKVLEKGALHDPVLQQASLSPLPSQADWHIEVAFRPGVTDNEGHTARDTMALVLGKQPETVAVYTSAQYRLWGKLSLADIENIARNLLANELIQRFRIKDKAQWQQEPGFSAQGSKVTGASSDKVAQIDLHSLDNDALMQLSRENTWALSLEEMQAIRNFYARPDVQAARAGLGLAAPGLALDAELEVLAQTWSEHCKHKIFAAHIDYVDNSTGQSQSIDSLYKTYIQNVTAHIRHRLGNEDFCRSVFKDNAGVVAFNNSHDLCIKVETHNSPSALDPYGGALTGIVGVNRDPMGTGMGAELVCNMDVFCFASPFYDKPLPPRLLHPRRVMEGVRQGVEDGGNKSGIPTVNGSVVFDERFLGKPLVFCGTVGLMPAMLHGKPGHEKKALPGDFIVMTGGRIGKDGIHGATFSSEELHEGSPATAVQIGDPITQRKMYDFIMRARDAGLYSAITDNGAGGLSSSVGEMCEDTGGCKLDLSKAPLKYDGLRPWEILLSEAQERMTLAVPPSSIDEFLALARHMSVEATVLGTYTESGFFHITYGEKTVAYLPMEFMHKGVPQLRLRAEWNPPACAQGLSAQVRVEDENTMLLAMLKRLNICSKEYMIRQYDHEVRGGSVVKPLVGLCQDGPADAAVLRPLLESEEGLVIGHGICPKFSDYDTYWMTANAVDEAVRNAVAVGADPDQLAGVDNFCWCDPVESEKTPDGPYKLAQLVRSCQALAKMCQDYGLPCVSGKDSMKNDYSGGGEKISIPPTLLFTVLGKMKDVKKAVTSDFKQAGHLIYILGSTRSELAGSELASQLNSAAFGRIPTVDAPTALARYRTLHKAMNKGLISACHDLSDGGLAVALAEMALGGRLGAQVNVRQVPVNSSEEELTASTILYSESASRLLVTINPQHQQTFEGLFQGQICACIGQVNASGSLHIHGNDQTPLIDLPVEKLAEAFKSTLNW